MRPLSYYHCYFFYSKQVLKSEPKIIFYFCDVAFINTSFEIKVPQMNKTTDNKEAPSLKVKRSLSFSKLITDKLYCHDTSGGHVSVMICFCKGSKTDWLPTAKNKPMTACNPLTRPQNKTPKPVFVSYFQAPLDVLPELPRAADTLLFEKQTGFFIKDMSVY